MAKAGEEADRFVPRSFRPPTHLENGRLHLVPLGPEHNERDYRAWQSSIEHIRHTPGFQDYGWPVEMPLAQNKRDLERHAADFRARTGFTYSVLIGDDVIGCVYIYPARRSRRAVVRSWVRADHADLDEPLYRLVRDWVAEAWPFEDFEYVGRDKQHEYAG